MRGETVYYVRRWGGITQVLWGRDWGAAITFDGKPARRLAGNNGELVTEDNVTTEAEYHRYQRFVNRYYGGAGKLMTWAEGDLTTKSIKTWQPERGVFPQPDPEPEPCELCGQTWECCC
jgi:hypothetical protein